MPLPLLLVALVACDGPTSGRACKGLVLVNEFVANPAGTDAGLEWIELYNPGGEDVDLSGWSFHVFKSEGSQSDTEALPDGTWIEAGGFLLVGGASVGAIDLPLETDLGSGKGGDGLALLDACGTTVDAVVYGGSNEDGAPDETGAASPTAAPLPGDDESLARCGDGRDSDTSGSDFFLRTADQVTPGASNACEPPALHTADEVIFVINEIMPDPAGADEGLEWIEIYNAGSTAAHLDAWTVAWHKSDPESPSGTATIPTGVAIPAGDVVLLGGVDVPGTDVTLDLDFGNGTSGDAVTLLDPEGTFEDAVIYGPPNDDGMLDEPGGAVATSLAEKPQDGEALARCPDGVDTDASAVDFFLLAAGAETPGAPNGDCGGSGRCDPADSVTVVINEFVPDPEGADTDREWVEIYNAGTSAADLSGWILEWYKGDPLAPSGDFTLPTDIVLEPRAFLVIAEPDAGVSSDIEAALDLGNGTSGDGLHLRDCVEDLADAVVYAPPNDDGILDESGYAATSVAENPDSGLSLGRTSDGVDTDRSGIDFCVLASPSAGSANGPCR
ncbi:MAG: lamin tail domain-containing protein [Deltaproteobacteria bacterium]|nr:lamin tail domain-containing protein [Deltaproteobacteria bacterium]